MWIKNSSFLWIKVRTKQGTPFHINFPLFLFAFEELLDCIMDLLDIACYFNPRKVSHDSKVSVFTIRELLAAFIKMFDSLASIEPYDLVDVEDERVKVSIKLR